MRDNSWHITKQAGSAMQSRAAVTDDAEWCGRAVGTLLCLLPKEAYERDVLLPH